MSLKKANCKAGGHLAAEKTRGLVRIKWARRAWIRINLWGCQPSIGDYSRRGGFAVQ